MSLESLINFAYLLFLWQLKLGHFGTYSSPSLNFSFININSMGALSNADLFFSSKINSLNNSINCTSSIIYLKIFDNSNPLINLGFNCNQVGFCFLESLKKPFKTSLSLIKYSNNGECSLAVEYEPVEFFLMEKQCRTLGMRVRLPPFASYIKETLINPEKLDKSSKERKD